MSWLVEKIYNIFARGSMISPVSTSPPSVVQAHSPICQGVATRLRSALSFGQHLAKQMMIVGDLSVDVVDLDTLNFRGSHSLYHLEGCLMRNLKWQPIPQGLKLRPSVRTIDVEDPPTPPPPPRVTSHQSSLQMAEAACGGLPVLYPCRPLNRISISDAMRLPLSPEIVTGPWS